MQAVRFSALDVLRGLIIGLMILVNTPGSWSHVYSPLLHASWDGFTVADIVFPGFLFVVGAAMFYALKQAPANAATIRKVVKRSVIMFGCGLLLNWFWAQPLAELRIFGVLQRIALCYLCAAFLLLFLRRWQISVQSSLPIALDKSTCKVTVGDDLGKCFGIKMIYFDLDKSNIRSEAAL
ncbi:MAG: heparan-alpha-glucosaminide N-acetyltransferase domain-containing protein, partial [Rheinheimera sp.]